MVAAINLKALVKPGQQFEISIPPSSAGFAKPPFIKIGEALRQEINGIHPIFNQEGDFVSDEKPVVFEIEQPDPLTEEQQRARRTAISRMNTDSTGRNVEFGHQLQV